MPRFFARTRRPLVIVGLLILFGSVIWPSASSLISSELADESRLSPWVSLVAMMSILLGVVLTFVSPLPGEAPLPLASPVRGDWIAVNSPTSKIPSHGTHAYGQTFAVDLLLRPEPGTVKSGFGFQLPSVFPSFGQPLYAPAPATVARVYDRARDHRSRTSPWALAYLLLESMVRDVLGTNRILGNHVVLRLEDGTHFVLAHLRRGSIRVVSGQSVAAGEIIAECGNSGNSTEPHLHCQRQDIAATGYAAGLPWTIQPGGIPPTFNPSDRP